MQSINLEDGVLFVFLSGMCNQECRTCPQELGAPALTEDEVAKYLSCIDLSKVRSCYITGGEPLLSQDLIQKILAALPERLSVFILTNGSIEPHISLLVDRRITFCVSLFSSRASVHNQMVGRDSYRNLLSNLYTMGSQASRIELRIVLGQYNHGGLVEFSRFVAMNLPFVAQVSFMGMELVESARKNRADLWVPHRSFIPELIKSLVYLETVGIDGCIYNFPLCLFPESINPRVKKTIGTWKREFPAECARCKKQEECGGFFSTTLDEIRDVEVFRYE